MKTVYKPELKAHVSVDAANKVRHLRHSQEYWPSEDNMPRVSAQTYLHEWADTLKIPKAQLANLSKKVSFLDPREQDVEYQLSEEKHLFDSTTVGYYQTYLNTPVWRKGLSVKVKSNPNRVVGSTNNSEDGLKGTLPDQKLIDRYAAIFRQAAARNALADAGFANVGESGEAETSEVVRKIINAPAVATRGKGAKAAAAADTSPQLLSGKFFIYKYDPKKRYAGKPSPTADRKGNGTPGEAGEIPLLDIPPVSDKIRPERAYLVAEMIFRQGRSRSGLVWLILVEVETGSILYIECMTCGVNGLVFKRDPINSSGDFTATANQPNNVLDDHDFDELLPDLDPPSGGVQSLSGLYVSIEEQDAPAIAAPTVAAGSDFDFNPRTNDFAAVNAYYHQTQLFRTIADMGFVVEDYFDGTTFPIPVDHRASFGTADGVEINAFWSPNGSGGTAFMGYCLCDLSDTANPLGRAVDPYVHWHEMGGHGVLGDHVGSGNLGFSHSHGDGLAAIQNDPESALRALPERFDYAPFHPTITRRFDRPVNGWAWNGGANDNGGYGSEEILATCHFRLYRSIGGDADSLGRRQFASRMATYLILRTTANLTPATNPNDPEVWCEEMQDTDLENWTSEGLSGGAYNKVIRWAFEKQGSYQPAGAPTPVTTEGAPPAVDVYIDDGRGGEYDYIHAHWNNQSMWNRNAPDGLPGHQNAIDGQTNYMYCKVKNRGANTANNVTVRAYHTLPGAGLTWPVDFDEMGPVGGLALPSIAGNNAAEETVGPFEWEPNINAYGHDCVLMIASADGDASNVDNFTPTETVQEWRLVPHDNNVGQRNVSVVPGEGGGEALMASLDGAFFMAGNNLNKKARMELKVHMPAVLASKGWKLKFEGIPSNKFSLAAGAKRKVHLALQAGADFTQADITGAADRMISIDLLGNGILLGGMSYDVDPNLKTPSGGKPPGGTHCDGAAQQLLDCLKIGGGKKVKKVCVKKVSIDIELDNDCACD